jgi:hypothetical protein
MLSQKNSFVFVLLAVWHATMLHPPQFEYLFILAGYAFFILIFFVGEVEWEYDMPCWRTALRNTQSTQLCALRSIMSKRKANVSFYVPHLYTYVPSLPLFSALASECTLYSLMWTGN